MPRFRFLGVALVLLGLCLPRMGAPASAGPAAGVPPTGPDVEARGSLPTPGRMGQGLTVVTVP